MESDVVCVCVYTLACMIANRNMDIHIVGMRVKHCCKPRQNGFTEQME